MGRVQRAAAALARKSSPAWTRRRVGLAAAVVLVLGGVAAGFAFLGSGRTRATSPARPPAPLAPAAAVTDRDRAAAWVASQVSQASMVSCDPATCGLIESHGFPASHVRVLGPGKGNPLVSNVVVATQVVRRQFGAQLTSVYAPCLLATFGAGSGRVTFSSLPRTGPPLTVPRSTPIWRTGGSRAPDCPEVTGSRPRSRPGASWPPGRSTRV